MPSRRPDPPGERPARGRLARLPLLAAVGLALACASAPPAPSPATPPAAVRPDPAAAAPSAPAPAAAGTTAGPLRRDPRRYEAALADLVFDGATAVRPRPGAHATGDAAELTRAARALRGQRRNEEALQAAAAAIVAAPGRVEGYEELSIVLRRVGRLARAEAALRTALRLEPHRVPARQALGELLWSTGRRDEAEDEWRRVIAEQPDHGPAWVRLAVAARFRGERDEARELLARAAAAGAPVPEQLLALDAEPPAASRAAAAAAAFELVAEPAVRLDPAAGLHQSAEPTLAAVGTEAGGRLLAAWIDTREQDAGGAWRIGFTASDDGGRSWVPDEVLPPPPASRTAFDGDPTFAVDPRTGTAWLAAASFGLSPGVWVRRVAPEVEPAKLAYRGNIDRPWLAAGPGPGDAGATRLYAATDRGLLVSADLGASWSLLLPYGEHPAGEGVGYLPRVGPGGELYVIFGDFVDGIHLLRSTDGGAGFEPPRRIATRIDFTTAPDSAEIAGDFRAVTLPVLAVDPVAGTLYAAWFDTAGFDARGVDLDLFLARSTDGGTTWSPPRRVLAAPGDQFFPWIEVDGASRLHLVYFDTERGGGDDGDPAALLDVVYAASDDGGESWRPLRLTPEPFSTAGAGWRTFDGRQFLGDYLAVVPIAGGAYVAYPAASPAGDLDILGQRVRSVAPCSPDAALCLGGARYAVSAAWRTAAGGEGAGVPLPLTADSGAFWFFAAANIELIVKLLDACPVNGHRWVFAAGLTDVEVELAVDDLVTGARRTYRNPQGTPFQPIADTAAIPCE